MHALAIVALVFAALSVFVPILGALIAAVCSVMAAIAFRTRPTLGGVTFGINIISTLFLSPFMGATSVALGYAAEYDSASSSAHSLFIAWHLTLLALAVVWRWIKGPAVGPAPPSAKG